MAADVEYKGWTIEQQSYKSERALWRPKALVSIGDGGNVHEYQVAAPPDVMYATQRDADAYAIEMAKKWIDERG
jgi:hypothetical protein